MWRVIRVTLVVGVAVLLAMQLVPYGWRHPNPPVVAEPAWPDAAGERLARAACYDCHSNETEWPIYSYVAPVSWLVRRDVEQGRDELNFSEWDGDADDMVETVVEGSMPPRSYTILHWDARLSDDEKQRLVAALRALEGADGDDRDDDDDDDDDD